LRISFAGGLTDIAEFYNNADYGAVVSTSINKYVFITVNKKFDNKTRVSYSKTEIVDNVKEIHHPIVREVLDFLEIKNGTEITCIGDFPSGTGMGSSSAFTVGLLNALHRYKGEKISPYQLAEEACYIEIDRLKEPIGKQDQYASAFGGINYIKFEKDTTTVSPISISDKYKNVIDILTSLHFIGSSGFARDMLSKQVKSFSDKLNELSNLRNIANKMREILSSNKGDMFEKFGEALKDQWLIKRNMSGVTNENINNLYSSAIINGAIGGKVCGAGGRGFLMLYSLENHDDLLSFMKKNGYPETPFSFEHEGSKIVYEGQE